MRAIRALFALACIVPTLARADIKTDTVRQRAEQACTDDAFKYCNDDVPDEDKVKRCMGRNRAKLAPACREVFDRGAR